MRITPIVAALCMAAFATAGGAQNTSHTHESSPGSIIDGSVHPELIPDSTAHRLYFIVVSELPNPTPEQRNRQIAHLRRIGLQNSDIERMIPALENFKTLPEHAKN
jgi:hypothetical protein